MKRILVIAFLGALLGCTQTKPRPKPNFTFIEVTYDNGWTGGQTVHIDSTGIIVKCKYHIISEIDTAICCQDTLTSYQMDTLISMIEKLYKAKIDSEYDGGCQDCGGYITKVVTSHGTIKSMIIGADKFQNEVAVFSRYISAIVIKPNKVDSVYVFETTKYLIPPIPPTAEDKAKFVPPDQPCDKCNIEKVKAVAKNINKLTFNLVAEFICTYDITCKNNAEFSEFANEILYDLITASPTLFFQVLEVKQVNRQHLLTQIENPVTDGIDLQKAYNSVKAASARKSIKTQFLNSIMLAATKGGQILSK